MLRIIGGKYRHLKIEAPDVDTTRPTTDRVREGLMSALSTYIPNKNVLDLFAGSGALGLESLSRGAKSATFVDANINAINTIKLNIKNIKIEEDTIVYFGKYKDFLNQNKDKKYGVVFLDPPYKMKECYDEIVNFLFDNDMLEEDAIVVKECDIDFGDDDRFVKRKSYKYGIIHLNVYWRK
jgi:16S rRNA (guanine966-N2)-methyltransferase